MILLSSTSDNVTFGVVLLAVAGVLIYAQRSRWTTLQTVGSVDERESEFLRQRHRRRQQTSSLIGVLGLAVMGGSWIHETRTAACYWLGVLLVVLWVVLLACADGWLTYNFYHQRRRRYLVEQAVLQGELKRELERRQEQRDEDDA